MKKKKKEREKKVGKTNKGKCKGEVRKALSLSFKRKITRQELARMI